MKSARAFTIVCIATVAVIAGLKPCTTYYLGASSVTGCGAGLQPCVFCGVSVSAQTSAPPRVPGLDTTGMDRSVRPQDDFFRFVNGTWVDKTAIPPDRSNYGSFAMLTERAQEALRGILEGEGMTSNPPGSIGQKVGGFYKSFMDEARIDARGIEPLKGELAAIDAVASARDLSAVFGRLSRIAVRLPFAVVVFQDPQHSDAYAVQINQAGLGMPDRDYYLRNDEKFTAIRKAYVDYIAKLFTLAGQKDPAGAAARILALETALAQKQWDRARNRDRNATYNKMTLAALQSSTPNFDWRVYVSKAVAPAPAPDVADVIVRQPDYLMAADAAIAATPVETWKEYLRFGLIAAYADDLPAAFVDAHFDFNGKTIAGRQENQPRWKRAVAASEETVGEPVGKLYIERYFKGDAKARMDALIKNLLAAFKAGIDDLEWMSSETKVQAQAKLAKFGVKIAYPDRWRDYTALDIDAQDLVGNVMRYRSLQAAEMWARFGKPVERWRWGFTPQTVNASYNPANNEITFPAGILQPPFFDVFADDAINYGAIGSVIGHEISHGFDDQGRKSDGDGNLRDWWTADDAKKFEARAAKLGAQFESYTPLPGMKINGSQTMGENIGDLSGIAVAYRAYKMSLKGATAPVIGGFTGDQRFFLGYAQVWRFKTRDEALRNQLLTDVHSPGMFRAFVPLTNIDAFYAAFDLKPGDKLYRAPADRVKIW
jgi:putative endopeptidase